ncbi:universal stress protein [Egicoccus sp. AB-alg2]|uniref:universal stress protein n=1 Tax=Egicoccus sp. AB-alg2 TaxID=3242693 RepID=UPI00359E4B38
MKVLVGVLDTPEGRAAVDAAADEVRRRDGELHLVVHVASPNDAQASRSFATDLEAARARAEAVAGPLRASGLVATVHAPVDTATPAEAILQVADEQDVDLIVLGLRRRSRVGKLVLGSNAQDVLLGAPVAVLAVKAPVEA